MIPRNRVFSEGCSRDVTGCSRSPRIVPRGADSSERAKKALRDGLFTIGAATGTNARSGWRTSAFSLIQTS
jgi:hypothetical protein